MRQKLSDLKDYILNNNTYFDSGYSDVILDETTGIVHNSIPVFPADNLGNYFYLRLPNQWQYDYNADRIGDNYLSVKKRANIFLVACVKDANADTLVTNLETTIGRYQDVNTKMLQCIYAPELVVLQELGKMKKENIESALQRIPYQYTMVSISFTLIYDAVFQSLNCIKNPCTPC